MPTLLYPSPGNAPQDPSDNKTDANPFPPGPRALLTAIRLCPLHPAPRFPYIVQGRLLPSQVLARTRPLGEASVDRRQPGHHHAAPFCVLRAHILLIYSAAEYVSLTSPSSSGRAPGGLVGFVPPLGPAPGTESALGGTGWHGPELRSTRSAPD